MQLLIRRAAGFTLIEMMISIAIIGLLASVAIPSFQAYQLRSKRSEAYSNLGAIATTQGSYFSESGIYFAAGAMPGPVPLKTKRAWTAAAEATFAGLGWIPEGNVYFDYDTNTNVVGGCGCTVCYTASAYGELDGDTFISTVMYVHPDPAGNTCPAAITGDPVPLDPGGNPIIDQPVVSPMSDDF